MKHMYITEEDIGNRVICDACGTDWTDRVESGGFLFVSNAYCPACAEFSISSIRSYGEEHLIRARCPVGMPFAKWCLQFRNGNNTIKITTTREE
jgi:hypothetical protein